MIVSRLTDKDVLSFLRLDGTEGDISPLPCWRRLWGM